MRIALVLGKKLLPSGSMLPEYEAQIQKAVSLLSEDKVDLIVISGGVTRAGFPSEAEVGLTRIPPELRTKVFIEDRSKSTSENVRFVRRMMASFAISTMIVITATAHEPRTRFYLELLWPEVCAVTTFDGIPTTRLKEHILHPVLFLLAILDPDERIFLPLIKKTLRVG